MGVPEEPTDDLDQDQEQNQDQERDHDRIAVDTSVLMAPVEAGVRPFEEFERLVPAADPVVPAAVTSELERLSTGGGREGRAASVGLELVDRCRVVETDAGETDDALVKLAAADRVAYVATNDLPLRDRVLDRGVPVIGLRARNKFTLTRP
jgi:rRNA-processing protein FCF1